MRRLFLFLTLVSLSVMVRAQPSNVGYYRFPAIHKDTIVFTSQGDLFKVRVEGGAAQALTTHPAQETHPAISPDGKRVAFTAGYEGTNEVYVMPIEGGLPKRLTYEGGTANVVGWTPDGKVLFNSTVHSTLPDRQLFTIHPDTLARAVVPLAQANQGVYDKAGGTLYFTRQPFQGSHTKRYKGGGVESIWKLVPEAKSAVPLTANFTGTSKNPMYWEARIYFASDRDGTMNLWSMNTNGGGLKQHTHHKYFDVKDPSLDDGHIVYQLGADLHVYDVVMDKDTLLNIAITSDLEQTREHWIKEPMDYLTHVGVSPDGSRVVLTARGQVFVAPVKQGRFVEVTRKQGVRYRNALFAPDGKSLYALSDETGETEWWRLPINGIGKPEQLTSDSKVLRTSGLVSPDGKWIAYTNKSEELWLFNIADRTSMKIATSEYGEYGDFSWSPDSQWLAFVEPSITFGRILLYSLKDKKSTPITTDRADSSSPTWSPDGKWLYFLSDRTFRSSVGSPWGPRQPEPFFDKQSKLYKIALTTGQRSPFQQDDELFKESKPQATDASKTKLSIVLDGIQRRLWEVPVPSGNYAHLTMNEGRLFWISRERDGGRSGLVALDIANKGIAVKRVAEGVGDYELSGDGKKLLIRVGNQISVVDASSAPASLDTGQLNLSDWTFAVQPREEWKQMLTEAWRLERDFFYDPKLHGIDYPAILKRHLPLVERVRDRAELSDLIASMVGELAALHIFVTGGDARRGQDQIAPAFLGASLSRDPEHSGWRVDKIYSGDPDYPNSLSPLARPGVELKEGDVIQSVNGVETFTAPDIAALLRNQEGKQVLLTVWEKATGKARDCIVAPISRGASNDLRYTDWELNRRERVETEGRGEIGYVHLRAMGAGDIAQWAKDFYPVFHRQGLIVDVRHNGGGNIDSWILEKLLRKAWFYWQSRNEKPSWNMQWAFRGHVVVLCDEHTGSDGEAFTEGFRRLGIGKVIGTRTWGGEVWLSFDNYLADNGIASAAENGVFGPEGKWLIEGHGVDPDIVVDNPPHETFNGEDAQLKAAILHLQKLIRERPVPLPSRLPFPNKAFEPKR